MKIVFAPFAEVFGNFLLKYSQFILSRFILLHLKKNFWQNVQLNAQFEAFKLLNPAAPLLTRPSPCYVHPFVPLEQEKH